MKTSAPAWPIVANAVGYQVVWFACVSGAAAGLAWPGLLAFCLFATAILGFGGKRAADLRALMIVVPIGFLLDSAFALSGWLHYSQQWPIAGAPLWIGAIWAAFALTLNHSLRFLAGRPWLAAILGAIGGPCAYAAARALGAVVFAVPDAVALSVLSVSWAIVLPATVEFNRRTRLHQQALA